MILQSLNAYYNRLKDDPKTDIPLFGFSRQKIWFSLLLNQSGQILQVLPLADTPKASPRLLVVPQEMEERAGTKIAPHFTWDNTMYALGNDSEKKPERCLKAFEAFRAFHHELCDGIEDECIQAVLGFLDSWNSQKAADLQYWEEMTGKNVVFAMQIDGRLQYVHERPAVQKIWMNYLSRKSGGITASCLVSGERTSVARIHPAIKGVRGAQTKGASIISFNLDAFKSYNKDQSYNAPVSEDIAFAYTTALNYLLNSDSRQKIQIADTSTVWWTETGSNMAEMVKGLFAGDAEEVDWTDNQYGIKNIRDFLDAFRKGERLPEFELENNFFILGLSPNASRLSVRFWHTTTVRDFVAKIDQHFQDLSLEKRFENDPDYPSVWRLLLETAALRKSENISPVLAGEMMRAVLTGSDYPRSLLTSVIIRIRADQTVNYLRAGMIKAYLTRKARSSKKLTMEVKMGLDKNRKDTGYRLGRLFAVLERAQKRAIPDINRTIRDSCYGSASATPKIIFPRLLSLKNHHISKMENKGEAVNLEKLIREIMEEVNDFPSYLKLEEQGLFAIGYYHQWQAGFGGQKKADKEEENE
jgi:CRISPR-associated protein Csd1